MHKVRCTLELLLTCLSSAEKSKSDCRLPYDNMEEDPRQHLMLEVLMTFPSKLKFEKERLISLSSKEMFKREVAIC